MKKVLMSTLFGTRCNGRLISQFYFILKTLEYPDNMGVVHFRYHGKKYVIKLIKKGGKK